MQDHDPIYCPDPTTCGGSECSASVVKYHTSRQWGR